MEKWTHPLFHSSQWNDLKLRPVWLAPDLALNNVAQIPEWVFPSHPIKIIIVTTHIDFIKHCTFSALSQHSTVVSSWNSQIMKSIA
jgi:hypothetical protein